MTWIEELRHDINVSGVAGWKSSSGPIHPEQQRAWRWGLRLFDAESADPTGGQVGEKEIRTRQRSHSGHQPWSEAYGWFKFDVRITGRRRAWRNT